VLSAFLPELGITGGAYTLLMTLALAAGGVLVALVGLARARRLRL
jgi:hypothetical protein